MPALYKEGKMAKKFLTGLNLVVLDTDPATGSEGELYFNSSASVAKIYQAGAWSVLGAGGGGGAITVSTTEPSSPEVGDGWYKNDTGELYIYDGTYWVEVNGVIEANGALTGITSIENPDYITFDTTPETSSSEQGTLSWNAIDGTLDLKLNSETTLQIGQEQHVRVHNSTGSTIPNGAVIYVNGESDEHGHVSIAPYIADGSVNVFNVMGLTTMVIPDGTDGYATLSGLVHGIDTSDWTVGQGVFASDTVPGGLTTTQPISPSETVSLGVVTKSDIDGVIFVQIDTGATADLITYNHIHSLLEATNVEAALDELAYKKADINSLTSNLVLYPTTASVAGISGYTKLVKSIDDPDYNDTVVNQTTGNLIGTGTSHLLYEKIADANIFTGTPGSINITQIGNIAKTSGNANAYSEFFFRVYHRDSAGTETLLGQSSTTGAINPIVLNSFEQFSCSGNFLLTDFNDTDRLVVKLYSNVINNGTQSYAFQWGGNQPFRILVPLPLSVTPVTNAYGSLLDTSTFNGVLSGADSNVQAAMETIDNIVEIPDQTGHTGEILTTTGSVLEWGTPESLGIATNEDLYYYLTSASATLLYQPISVRLYNLTALENVEGFLRTDGGLGWGIDTAEYLTTENASSTYLTQLDASGLYITQIDAENTYLTPETSASIYQPLDNDLTAIASLSGSSGFLKKNILDDWVIDSNTYLTTYDAGITYQPVGNYATIDGVETLTNKTMSSAFIDGSLTFNDVDYEHAISSGSNNFTINAYQDLYLTTTTGSIILNPDHFVKIGEEYVATQEWVSYQNYLTIDSASATYSEINHNHTLDSLSNVVITGTPSDGQAIVWDTTTSKWVNETVSGGGGASYPDQSGNNGKFLQTNGSTVSWAEETDPVFVASEAYNIISADTANWNAAYSWGDHSLAGYLTEYLLETDPIFVASEAYNITSTDTGNWDSAYGWGDHSTYGYLTSYLETSTLQNVTDRESTTTNAITISNTTQSTTPTSGALIISGGVGIAKDVWIDGNLHVNGTTVTENTKTVATHDNLIYLNAAQDSTITNAVGDGTYVTYTADNDYTVGMDIRVTGMNPSGYNISSADGLTIYSATSTQFVVEKIDTGSFVSGGTAHAKEEANPDLGFAGGYYDAGYAHAGLFRDASDGVFKFFQGYTPEPDEVVNIDTTHASFAYADISVKRIIPQDIDGNFGIGNDSLYNVTGYNNFGIGRGAFTWSSGNSNYIFGEYAGSASGSYNYIFGQYAGQGSNGSNNYAIGSQALAFSTGNNNYAFGENSGRNNDGSDNLFLGKYAGSSNSIENTGNYNVYIGKSEGLSTSNNIVIADNEGNVQAQWLSASSGWILGTITSGTWNGTEIGYAYGGTGLTSLGTAGSILRVNSGATGLEYTNSPTFNTVTTGEAITKTTSTSLTSGSPITIATFSVPYGSCIVAECTILISSTSNGSYTSSKILITADPDFNATADITEYAVMQNNDNSLNPAFTATISGTTLSLKATVENWTATTAKVISTSILSPMGAA